MIRARASDPRAQGMEKPAGISVHFIMGGETVGKNANNHSIFPEYSRASNFFLLERRAFFELRIRLFFFFF